jgi:GR25 family glycosyltransferase involved in LPS biosynthesis
MIAMDESAKWQHYVINIDSSEERFTHFSRLNAEYGREVQRISAVTPKNTDLSQAIYVSQSVAACWESHLKLLRLFLQSDNDFAFVQEDDSILKKFESSHYVDFMKKNSIDFLQVGFLYGTIGRKIEILGKNLLHISLLIVKVIFSRLQPSSNINKKVLVREIFTNHANLVPADVRAGTHAYLISRHFAEHVIRMNKPIFLAADDYFMAMSRMRSFAMYRLFKSKARQGSWTSTVVPNVVPKRYS